MDESNGLLRRRKKDEDAKPEAIPTFRRISSQHSAGVEANSYWLTRIVFVRSLGFLYLVAFLVALHQNRALLGRNGLLPLSTYLSRVKDHVGASTNWDAFAAAPTLFWWVPEHSVDVVLDGVAYAGLMLATLPVVLGSGNLIIFLALWVLYHSLVNVGQRWYSFGWESQLLETGFLAIFLCPVLNMRQLPEHTPVPWVVVWGYRWLLFRIMLGAGLIKIRGDQCWRDLTCMNYHYETQPVPNPLSYYLHQMPQLVHSVETMGNHVIELVVPFLIFFPRPFRIICGVLQILFQVVLILSGNLSFLNWLTILPAIFCFDDKFFVCFFHWVSEYIAVLQENSKGNLRKPTGYYIRQVSSTALGLLLAYLSIPVVQNMLSRQQVMNTSFDPLRIVNSYGAFGSITKERTELIFEGTHNSTIGSNGELAHWQEIEFKCKPGDPFRRPCIISPYHYRLDWLMWFAAFQDYQHNPWLIHFAGKLLMGDPVVNNLIAHNPFQDQPPNYKYSQFGSTEARQGQWWQRKLLGSHLPPLSAMALKPVIKAQGWTWVSNEQNK